MSGFRYYNLYVAPRPRARWVTGGSYGVEAGAVRCGAILLGILIVWQLPLGKLSQPADRVRAGPRCTIISRHTKG